jgi:4-amino-4-deoxy-L-arabinose transferase-like glycosyltransferase
LETPIRLPGYSQLRKAPDPAQGKLTAPSSPGSLTAITRYQVAGLASVAALFYLFKLGTGALLDWDEAIYAEVSKEMIRGHHWLTPYWQSAPFFQKPPLTFWIQGAFFHLFGVSEFSARFASALAGVAVVLLTYGIARRLAGATAGVFAGFVLLTTNHFDRVTREATTDALLCLCIYLALYAWIRRREGNPLWFYLACLAVGAGAMIKGPAVLVAPLAIALDWALCRRSERTPGWRELCLGGLLALAAVAPWHIWMIIRYGRPFLDEYFGHQLFARATSVLESSGGGSAYYLGIVFFGAFPWCVVALFAAARWLWQKEWEHSLAWALIGILVFGYSLIPTKHEWYVIPIYPAIAIEVGRLLSDAGRKWRIVHYAAIAVIAIGLCVALAKLVLRQGDAFTNQVAQLATMAGSTHRTGPLLMITGPGRDPRIDTPTATFYSDRRAELFEMPGDTRKIMSLLKSRSSIDAIIQRDAFRAVSQQYEVRRIAQNDTAVYAAISLKHPQSP